jgi:putative PIN family toxin of toxin-antitoxin system
MPERTRFVADTNVLISRLLFRQSAPALALRHAMSNLRLIVSSETLIELASVLSRSKFDRYVTPVDRRQFLERLRRVVIHIPNVPPIAACRDPTDDKFLALSVAGRATFILTGDEDLLTLHPFREIAILSPRQYLESLSAEP